MGSLPPQYKSHSHGSGRNTGPSSTRPYADSAMDTDQQYPGMSDPDFDIFEWHPAFESCQKYFLDHAQYEQGTLAVCALINIKLPHQWLDTPITCSQPSQSTPSAGPGSTNFTVNAYSRNGDTNSSRSRGNAQLPAFISLVPYIRRLIVTGFDKPDVLHGFFGDDYIRGIMPHVDCERRNYLFAAKHGGWRSCKRQYDVGSGHGDDETVPFMKPLDEAKSDELVGAEKAWSEWLAMEDWMVGPRAPQDEANGGSAGERGHRVARHVGDLSDGLPDGVPEEYHSR